MSAPSTRAGGGVKESRRVGAARPTAGGILGAVGLASLAAMGAVSAAIVAGAQSGLDVLVPAAKLRYPDWLHGPLKPLELELSNDGLAWLLLALCAAYVAALACARAIPPRAGLAAIVVLHVLYVLAPPLLSSDVFGYIDVGRLGAVHGIDPYSPVTTPLPEDEVYDYRRWGSDIPTPYGPLFVLLMYPLGALGVPAALWSLKVLLGAASLATVMVVRLCAERLGQDPHRAALFVGLNPVLLLWGVGGAHNDFVFVLALVAAIALTLGGRERPAAAAVTVGAAIKASAGLPLLYLVAGARARRDALTGAAIAAAAMLALAATFGSDVVRLLEAIRDQQDAVALFSFPNQLGDWLGFGGITGGIRAVALAAFVATLALTLRAAWRGTLTWFAAAGWATAALLVTSAWLLPWYLVWLLPLAALSGDRRLKAAALAIGGFVVYTRVDLWFGLGG